MNARDRMIQRLDEEYTVNPALPSLNDYTGKVAEAMARRLRGQCDTCERQNDSDESGSCSVCLEGL